ncbi:MAG: hypothetical protein KAW14_12450 [Candidatus Aegiribacteria sp.]|nr:hypothetical protein [Candidatus Aegiribacteria sp.]
MKKPIKAPFTGRWNRTMLSSGEKKDERTSNPGCAGKTATDLEKADSRSVETDGQAA